MSVPPRRKQEGLDAEKSDSHRVSRDHFSVVNLGENDDKEQWRSRTIEERLEYMEYLRRVNYGDAAAGRLQRVLEVVERKSLKYKKDYDKKLS